MSHDLAGTSHGARITMDPQTPEGGTTVGRSNVMQAVANG